MTVCFFQQMNNLKQQIKIRPLQEKDKNAVESICIATAPEFLINTENRRKRTLLLYCDYYTRMREHSFVAVNENDEAVGYIFCEPDNSRYKSEFKKAFKAGNYKLYPWKVRNKECSGMCRQISRSYAH